MRISVMIPEIRKESVEREDWASWGALQPEAEPVATRLQRTQWQIILFVVVVAALLIAIIASYGLMPRGPIPLRESGEKSAS